MKNSKSNFKVRILGLSIAFVLVLFLNACNETMKSGKQGQGSASYITAKSYSDLTKSVSIIVIGEMTAVSDYINIARDDADPTKTSVSRYEIGQVYEFTIDEYLKGSGESQINVVQVEGFLSQKEAITDESITHAKEAFNFLSINSGKKYLLFLSDLVGFSKGEYYIGPIHPWRFDITDPEGIIPESPWQYARQAFPPVSLDLIREQIRNPEAEIIPAVQWDPYTYPAPTSVSPLDDGNPYP